MSVDWENIQEALKLSPEDIDTMPLEEVEKWSKILATFFGGNGDETLGDLINLYERTNTL